MLGKYIVVISSEFCRGWEGNYVEVFENTKGFKTMLEWLHDGKDEDEIEGFSQSFHQYYVRDNYIGIESDEYNVEYKTINDLQELVSKNI